jgi:hypothetical protein
LIFLFRLVLFALLFCFVVYVLKMIARLSYKLRATITDVNKLRALFEGRPSVSAEMVRCQSCGAFTSAKEAVTISSAQSRQTFCSRDCMQAHVKRA